MARNANASILLDYATPDGRRQCSISAERVSASYLDLRFNGSRPAEVINIYDYATGRSTVTNDDGAVLIALTEWAAAEDAEELAYRLADYSDPDDQDEVRAQWASGPERAWLLNYLANAS